MNIKTFEQAERVSLDLVSSVGSLYKSMCYNDKKVIGEQILRATISIGSNISEGKGRGNYDEIRFFKIALGSCQESIFQVKCLNELDIIDETFTLELFNKFSDLLNYIKTYILYITKRIKSNGGLK